MCIGHASLLRHIVFRTCTHVIIIFYLVTINIYTPGSRQTCMSLIIIQSNPTYASFIINPPLMIPGAVSVSLLKVEISQLQIAYFGPILSQSYSIFQNL